MKSKQDVEFKYGVGDIVVDKLRNTFDGGGYYLISGLCVPECKYEVVRIGTNNIYFYTLESLEYFFTKVA
jgi:hypothetical protein